MKVLELFAGTRSVGKVFEERGHDVISIDWDTKYDNCIHLDIYTLTVDRVIELCNGIPEVIWCSPDCTTYSIASGGLHRAAQMHDYPKTEYAKFCDHGNTYLFTDLIPKLLSQGTKYVFIENPVGRFYKMSFIQNYHRYIITYNQYGSDFQKRTHIFSNYSSLVFKKPLYGSYEVGVKECNDRVLRSVIPSGLCHYIVDIVEEKDKRNLTLF